METLKIAPLISLKNCPFCGSEAAGDSDRGGRYYEAYCTNPKCEARIRVKSTPYVESAKEAKLRWNKRD